MSPPQQCLHRPFNDSAELIKSHLTPPTLHLALFPLHQHHMLALDVLAELHGHGIPHEKIHPERQVAFL